MMAVPKTYTEVSAYEKDHEECRDVSPPTLRVHSHCIRENMVIIAIGKTSLTVLAADLIRAVQNASD